MPHAKPFRQDLQNFGGRIQVIRLKNSSPAVYRLYQAHLGWRPEFAFVATLTDTVDRKQGPPVVPAFNPATGYKVDGSTYARGSHGMVRTGAGQDELAGVLGFEDYGIEVGRSGSGFHHARREMAIVAFQSEVGPLVYDLDDGEPAAFGADSGANAFKYPNPLGDLPDWIFCDPDGPQVTLKMLKWAVADASPASVAGYFTNRFTRGAASGYGAWQYDTDASTSSNNTGPGTNNDGPFVFTESSGGGTDAQYETHSSLTLISTTGGLGKEFLEDGANRSIHIRCCLQGLFADISGVKSEGLAVQHRATSGAAWTTAHVIRGWAYSNSYSEGDEVTDHGSVSFTVAEDGGWRDVAVDIPDTAKEVRIQPLVIFTQTPHLHDIAIKEIELRYEV